MGYKTNKIKIIFKVRLLIIELRHIREIAGSNVGTKTKRLE
jgi:hypothetical protein